MRTFSQDDAHIFCTPEQVESEIVSFIAMVYETFGVFGFTDVRVALSLRPEKRIGTDELWDEAERLVKGPHPGDLNQALMELGATVCTPRTPRCLACPLMRSCDAHRAGAAGPYRAAPGTETLPRHARRARLAKCPSSLHFQGRGSTSSW